jgi:hypothetical protein
MPLSRKISRVVTVPPIGPGFAGPAHIATTVIPPGDFEATDPFFRMMDDRVSVAGQFGGEHPHAGLETVTFILSGTMLGDFMRTGLRPVLSFSLSRTTRIRRNKPCSYSSIPMTPAPSATRTPPSR